MTIDKLYSSHSCNVQLSGDCTSTLKLIFCEKNLCWIWTQDLATDICFLARHLNISGNFLWISHNPWQYYRTLNFKIKKPSPNHLGSEHHRDGRIITSVSHFLLLLLLQWRQNNARGRTSPLFLSLGWAQAFKVSIAWANVYVHVANLDPWQIVF